MFIGQRQLLTYLLRYGKLSLIIGFGESYPHYSFHIFKTVSSRTNGDRKNYGIQAQFNPQVASPMAKQLKP